MPIQTIVVRGRALVEEVVVIKSDGDRDHLRFSGQRLETAALTSEDIALLELAKQL
jgi:hypothetical protein